MRLPAVFKLVLKMMKAENENVIENFRKID